MNSTIDGPVVITTDGNADLFCYPPLWYDYVTFFFANFIVHTATVVSEPGQSWTETGFVLLSALLLPSSGVLRSLRQIRTFTGYKTDPLKRALKARALCMVVRHEDLSVYKNIFSGLQTNARDGATESQEDAVTGKEDVSSSREKHLVPDETRDISGDHKQIKDSQVRWWKPFPITPLPYGRKVHGRHCLPPGYTFAIVPSCAPVQWQHDNAKPSYTEPNLASKLNLPKVLISFVQAIWAVTTLYRARGDQIDRYGFAAFGLTVTPYAFMSVTNIIANACAREYPAFYLIRTPLLDEAEEKPEGVFDGIVGSVDKESLKSPNQPMSSYRVQALMSPFFLFLLFTPFVLIAALSGLRKQYSTPLQQGFTLSWLICGIVLGPTMVYLTRKYFLMLSICQIQDERYERKTLKHDKLMKGGILLLYALVFGVPAIGGMIIVGLMLREFGMCMRL